MEHDTDTLPADYERCGTCGYDHTYDLPILNVKELEQVKQAHGDDDLTKFCVKFPPERV